MAEFAADDGADLCDFLGFRAEPVETRQQRCLQCGRDVSLRDVEAAFNQRFRQFLDEERHPIGA